MSNFTSISGDFGYDGFKGEPGEDTVGMYVSLSWENTKSSTQQNC